MEKKKDFSILLNGGSTQMDDATVPVKWFFSEEFIKKEPRYILLVDLKQAELTSYRSGRRYLFEVEDAIAFLQMRSAGNHRLIALCFSNRDEAVVYLERDKYSYDVAIDVESIQKGKDWGASLASTYVDFQVPKELFAKKPESKLAKMWWKYLFWPITVKPTDECQVRRLNLLALPKLPLYLLVKVLALVGVVLYAIYNIIAPPIALFIGWWPIPWRDSLDRIIHPKDYGFSLDVRAGCCYLAIYHQSMWKKDMFISPLVATILGVTGFMSIYLLKDLRCETSFFLGMLSLTIFFIFLMFNKNIKKMIKLEEKTGVIVIATILIILGGVLSAIQLELAEKPFENLLYTTKVIATFYLLLAFFATLIITLSFLLGLSEKLIKKANKRSEIYREKVNRKDKESYQDFLQAFTKPEKKVSLAINTMPKTFKKSQLKRDSKIRFWTIKRKVCRPYEG